MKETTKKQSVKATKKEEIVMKDAKAKVTKKESTKKVDKKQEVKVETKAVETEKKEVVKKSRISVQQFTNSEFAKLFTDNGCKTECNPKDTSNVVYNQFGTKSRILQQGSAYQLLLTNGHTKKKDVVLDVEYNDVERFKEWYQSVDAGMQSTVKGYAEIDAGKLSDSEFPREKTVKLTTVESLKSYLQFMSKFAENAIQATA